MPRTRALRSVAEPPQVVPAALGRGRTAGGAFDPGSSFASGPAAAFHGRGVQCLGQGVLLGRREERGAAGMLGAPVREPSKTVLIVAGDQGMDPFVTQADEGSRGFRCLALADEPQGLVTASAAAGVAACL